MAEMTGTTSDPAMEQPELPLEEIRAGNKRGLWVLLALATLALVIAAVVGLKDIFVGRF